MPDLKPSNPKNRWKLTALAAGLLLCVAGFVWRSHELGRLLDERFWYTPDDANTLFRSLGQRGRGLYAVTQVTFDLVFPLLYGSVFYLSIVKLYSESGRPLLLIPAAPVLADLVENTTTAYLSWSYNGRADPLTWFAAVATATKWSMVTLVIAMIVVGAIAAYQRSSSN